MEYITFFEVAKKINRYKYQDKKE